jgi:predicted membrane chloride channel (bestrophin family)
VRKVSISNIILALILGVMVGSVTGSIIDKLFSINTFSSFLLKKAIVLDFYTIKLELQLSPGSLIGLVVTAYLIFKKGY